MSSRLRVLLCVCAGYLAAYGAGLASWMSWDALHERAPLDVIGVLVCMLPALFCVVSLMLHAGRAGDAQQFIAKAVGWLLVPPFLLLFWAHDRTQASTAASLSTATPEQTESALPLAVVFAGAQRGEPIMLAQGAMRSMHNGIWPDGSELHLMRFVDASEARKYLGFLAQTGHAEPITLGQRRGMQLLIPNATAFVYVEAIGSDLFQMAAKDRATAAAHLDLPGLPPSAAVDVAVTTNPPSSHADHSQDDWKPILGLALGHLLVFVIFVLWAAAFTTRIDPSPTAAAVDASEMRQRLASLANAGLGCALSPSDDPARLVLEFVADGDATTTHDFLLTIDASQRAVFVIERERHRGAPRNAEEAEMDTLGDLNNATTAPKAQWVASNSRLVTFVEPTRLESLHLVFESSRALFGNAPLPEQNGNHVAYALAAVITASGYSYRPRLFGARG